MAEFSLDIDEIKNDVENTIKEEEVKLENSNLKNQADQNATAIFEADLNNPQEREGILKPLDNFGLSDMSKSASWPQDLLTSQKEARMLKILERNWLNLTCR
jgi:hypothetical protein